MADFLLVTQEVFGIAEYIGHIWIRHIGSDILNFKDLANFCVISASKSNVGASNPCILFQQKIPTRYVF